MFKGFIDPFWPHAWQSHLEHLVLLLARLIIGGFLIWGVLDNIVSHERMQEFVTFLTQFNFAYPEFMAPLSVWAQFLIGVAFVIGLFTRIAAVFCILNFLVAIAMVDSLSGIRASFPSICLILFSLNFIVRGAGHWSIDKFISKA